MKTLSVVFVVLVGFFSADSAIAKFVNQFVKAVPAELNGTWDVAAVRVDAEAGAYKLREFPNDLRFMGIELVIEQSRVIGDITNVCEKPAWQTRRSTVKKETRIWRPPNPSYPKGTYVSLDVLGFREIKADDPVTTYDLRCADKAEKKLIGSHFFMAKSKDRLYAWSPYGFHAVLKRRLSRAEPSPSFSCASPLTKTKKTICGSVALAARERAISELWKNYIQNASCEPPRECRPDQLTLQAQRIEEQRAWLVELDKCHGDASCVLNTIRTEMEGSLGSNQFNDGNKD
jgi:hypothetical protein